MTLTRITTIPIPLSDISDVSTTLSSIANDRFCREKRVCSRDFYDLFTKSVLKPRLVHRLRRSLPRCILIRPIWRLARMICVHVIANWQKVSRWVYLLASGYIHIYIFFAPHGQCVLAPGGRVLLAPSAQYLAREY